MKNECSIVGDLLALWMDGLVSEDTAAFVEEHLDRCPAAVPAWSSCAPRRPSGGGAGGAGLP